MKKEKAARAMEYLDDGLIAEAMNKSDFSGESSDNISERRNNMIKKNAWKKWTAVAAMLAIVVSAGLLAALYGGAIVPATDMTVALDVNPSIEIEIDKNEKITDVRALNEEAVIVIGNMELKKVGLDVGVNAIIGSMLKNGYLSTSQNSILVSVKSNDEVKAATLKEKLSSEIDAILRGSNIEASLLTQTFNSDKDISKKARENNISNAKANLISKIVSSELLDAGGVPYTYEILAQLNVNELKLILESKEAKIDGIGAIGVASDSGYISSEKAVEIAVNKSGAKADIYLPRVEMDYDDDCRAMVYEVEFYSDGKEYEYEIDAKTGAVLDEDIEKTDKYYDTPSNVTSSPVLTEKESDTAIKPPITDVYVSGGNTKAEDGKAPSTETYVSGLLDGEKTEKISRQSALEIAYKDAGVSENDVRREEIELDFDDGIYVYEIEFKSGGMEYEYKIDAIGGKILEKEKEPID